MILLRATGMAQQSARLSLVRVTRTTAVAITVCDRRRELCAVVFVAARSRRSHSVAGLPRVAVAGHRRWCDHPGHHGVGGVLGIPEQRPARRYFWILLTVGASVSVSGNAVHAMIPNPASPYSPSVPGSRPAVACVPPIALVGANHALSILWRFTPYDKPDEQALLKDSALALAAERSRSLGRGRSCHS